MLFQGYAKRNHSSDTLTMMVVVMDQVLRISLEFRQESLKAEIFVFQGGISLSFGGAPSIHIVR